jgi:glycerol-3-phosphate acyltransferase PlsX
VKIALDALGADNSPDAEIAGAKLALESLPEIQQLLLVGDEDRVRRECEKQGLSDPRIEFVHAAETVTMDESALKAVRLKKKSSINIAADLVKNGDAGAIVSAGNTGAVVAASRLKIRCLEGVKMPGIVAPLPNRHAPCNLLDAGANVNAEALHLLHYAIMGSVYAERIQGIENPVVGLMSVGEEDEKGTNLTKAAFEVLKNAPINFRGNVEGTDLFESKLNVVICDGFVGNVVLKTCEGTAKFLMSQIKEAAMSSLTGKIGGALLKPALKPLKYKMSAESVGGSPLLGINGICIISHGSSNGPAIANAIRVAADAIRREVNPLIQEKIASLG